MGKIPAAFQFFPLSLSVIFHNFFTLVEVRKEKGLSPPFLLFIKSHSKDTLHVYEEIHQNKEFHKF